jgi:hypothetical protein
MSAILYVPRSEKIIVTDNIILIDIIIIILKNKSPNSIDIKVIDTH